MVEPLQKTVWRFCKKLEMELPCDTATTILGIYLRELKSRSCKDTYTPMFVATLFTMAMIWEQSKYLLKDESIRRRWFIYRMEYYSALKKKGILLHETT